MIVDRVNAGLARAKANGVKPGRGNKKTDEKGNAGVLIELDDFPASASRNRLELTAVLRRLAVRRNTQVWRFAAGSIAASCRSLNGKPLVTCLRWISRSRILFS
jgi:hypothetical protein